MTEFADSGLRWCIEHASPHQHASAKIGRIANGTPMCQASLAQAWRAWDPAFGPDEWPTECRHVPLLVGAEPVAVEGQGVLL